MPHQNQRLAAHWIWLQLIIGWLPVWALFAALIHIAHGGPLADAAQIAARMVAAAALLGLLVHRGTSRLPWPHPFELRFVAAHLVAAALFSSCWVALNSLLESLIRGRLVLALGPGLVPYLVTGVWMYVMVAGVAYALRAAERTARIEALEAQSQLAALRTQLQPHFLFNALHTVVQLIPFDPKGAVRAAELLSGLLRSTLEQPNDLVSLADEWSLVQRYLALESIRFGDRLRLRAEIAPEALTTTLPSFALQTLVENAVRHAAAPSVQPTEIVVIAQLEGSQLRLTVSDSGEGASPETLSSSPGTGLRRLRERLVWLYGDRAELALTQAEPRGLRAMLRVPQLDR